jgi:gamma-glutamyl:cysteine ligase YbdK (ATP-grasp superfamily)
MNARLIDPVARSLIPVRETLDGLLAQCRPHAVALGCAEDLDRVPRLAAATGADRQRVLAAAPGSIEQLVAKLAGRFLAPHRLALTAGPSL